LPFMEQQNVFDLANLGTNMTNNNGAATNSHLTLRGTSIAGYFCPSRRTPPALTTNNACSVGDYAAVAYGLGQSTTGTSVAFNTTGGPTPAGSQTNATIPRTWDGAIVVCRAFNSNSTAGNAGAINGFQAQTLGPREYRSMTSFASVLDGLSNTAFVGEKAVHKDRLGLVTAGASYGDGPYYYYGGNNTLTGNSSTSDQVAPFMRRLCLSGSATAAPDSGRIIALKPTGDTNNANDPRFRFGSWHPGISLFLLGDGSVRQCNNATSSQALERFGTRNDRFTFDLP
jgi:hypothetical protein